MSEKNKFNRRDALKATGGVGGALLGLPTVVAGESEGRDEFSEEELERMEKEIEQDLSETPLVVGQKGDNQYETDDAGELDFSKSDIPNNVDIFVGEYQNAKVPTGKPYAIESKEEWLARESSPGFDSNDSEVTTEAIPDLYFKEDLGSYSLAGYTVEMGIGFGVTFSTGPIPGAGASISVDFYINGFTVTPFEFSVEVGVTEEGLCLKEFKFSPPKLPGKVTVEGCFDFGVETTGGGDVSVFGEASLETCLNPCSPANCSACVSPNTSISYPS